MQIFNRRAAKCGHCGALIPDEIKLTEEQKINFDKQLEQEKKRSIEAEYSHDVSGGGHSGVYL